jgi:hypothetical protein
LGILSQLPLSFFAAKPRGGLSVYEYGRRLCASMGRATASRRAEGEWVRNTQQPTTNNLPQKAHKSQNVFVSFVLFVASQNRNETPQGMRLPSARRIDRNRRPYSSAGLALPIYDYGRRVCAGQSGRATASRRAADDGEA